MPESPQLIASPRDDSTKLNLERVMGIDDSVATELDAMRESADYRYMDVPAAKGGERRVKTTLFARLLPALATGRPMRRFNVPNPTSLDLERVMGIEPTLVAWEATVLPLNYTRVRQDSMQHSRKQQLQFSLSSRNRPRQSVP